MIQSAFKSAEMNKAAQMNKMGNTVSNAAWGFGTAVIGASLSSAASLGGTTVQGLLGIVDGKGGKAMAGALSEKEQNAKAKAQYLNASEEQFDAAFDKAAKLSTSPEQDAIVDTVFATLAREREKYKLEQAKKQAIQDIGGAMNDNDR